MRRRSRKSLPWRGIPCTAGILLLLLAGLCNAAIPRVSQLELTRYRAWVKNLQPDSAEIAYPKSYFPGFENVKPEWARLPSGRMLSATRSVLSIEDVLIREWEKAKLITSKQSLGVARSYRLASEYDEAIDWFDRTFSDGGYTYPPPPSLAEEIFATAILTCDSLTVTRELLNVIGYSDLTGYDNSIILALRYLISREDRINLEILQHKIEAQQERLETPARYWYARSLVATRSYENGLAVLRKISLRSAVDDGLSARQRRWVLRAIPDLLYRLGHESEARSYYRILADGPRTVTGESGRWARYQIANYLLRDGAYDAARAYYQEFRDLDPSEPWHERARDMSRMLEDLASIRKDGVPYGIDDIHSH